MYVSEDGVNDKVESYLIKPALTGAVAAIISKATVMRGNSSFNVGEMQVPVWVAAAGAGYLASLVGEISSDYVLPMISKDSKFGSVSGLVQPGIVGLGNLVAYQAANSNAAAEKGPIALIGVGALAEVVADYSYNRFWKPLMS